MADIGYVRGQLNAIKDEQTRIRLINVFEHLMGNWRFGAPAHQTRTENAQIYWENSTTHGTANTEFSFQHGLTTTPKYALMALELDRVGSGNGLLTVTRAADANRIYLRSASTSVPILLMIE